MRLKPDMLMTRQEGHSPTRTWEMDHELLHQFAQVVVRTDTTLQASWFEGLAHGSTSYYIHWAMNVHGSYTLSGEVKQ